MTFRNLKEWKKIEVVFDLENEVWMVELLDFWRAGSLERLVLDTFSDCAVATAENTRTDIWMVGGLDGWIFRANYLTASIFLKKDINP